MNHRYRITSVLGMALLLSAVFYLSWVHNNYMREGVDFLFLLLMNGVLLFLSFALLFIRTLQFLNPATLLFAETFLKILVIGVPVGIQVGISPYKISFTSVFILMGMYLLYTFWDKYWQLKEVLGNRRKVVKNKKNKAH